jgi:hypothetical protein
MKMVMIASLSAATILPAKAENLSYRVVAGGAIPGKIARGRSLLSSANALFVR